MAKTIHANTSTNTKKQVFSANPSVVGERGTAAIEQNPQGLPEVEEEEEVFFEEEETDETSN